MRVTNKMMTSGMLNNIMSNKSDMNTKFNQYATQQKIQRPSEDPVIAIRSLKYRSNYTQISQFLEKNVEDAYNWMDVTESALTQMAEVLGSIQKYVDQGANDSYDTIQRDSISSQLQQYKTELYSMLNTDCAGRYVFSGYRTDSSVCYLEDDDNKQYTITENLTFENMFEKKYVSGCIDVQPKVDDQGNNNPNNTADYYAGNYKPETKSVYCLNLGYANLDVFDETTTPLTGCQFEYTKADGTAGDTIEPILIKSTDADAYDCGDNEVYFIQDTGEIIFGKGRYEDFRTAKDITVTYKKSEFKKDDVRPEMYYDCSSLKVTNRVPATGKIVQLEAEANRKYYKTPTDQDICYNISTSQSLKVNTLANQTINTAFSRAIDNIMQAVEDAYDAQTKFEKAEQLLSDSTLTDDQKEAYTKYKEQCSVELALKKDLIREAFSSAITTTQQTSSGTKVAYSDGSVKRIGISIAEADLGSRYSRLDLIKVRLEDQQTSITELMDSNEKVNLEEAIVNYNAAEMTYNASLSATSKVVQNSLLDFL